MNSSLYLFACLSDPQITCSIAVSRQGLSEREIKAILNVSDQAWSSIYFAMGDFLLEISGLYRYVHHRNRAVNCDVIIKFCQKFLAVLTVMIIYSKC